MAKIVTIINFKGGVGKTTCAIEISASLAKFYGKRTLLVDLDPQASATFYVMRQEHWRLWKDTKGSTCDLFEQNNHHFSLHNAIVQDVVQGKDVVFGFDLLPSSPDLVDIDLRLTDFVGYTILQRHLDQVRNEYDYIICDCPPNFNPVTKNALFASDAYVVPTVPDFLSTYGIGLLQRSVNKLFGAQYRTQAFTGPALGGIILTRVKGHVILHKDYCDQVYRDYPGKVFKHTISDSIVAALAADNRTPISAMKSGMNEAQHKLQGQYQGLAGEFIVRIHHSRSQVPQEIALFD
jgi:chromosome partitioning protein